MPIDLTPLVSGQNQRSSSSSAPAAKAPGNEAKSIQGALRALSIEHYTPLTTWDWISLQPGWLAGCYFTVKTDSNATIYITKSSALKEGLDQTDLKDKTELKNTCLQINRLILADPNFSSVIKNKDNRTVLLKYTDALTQNLQKLQEGQAIALLNPLESHRALILHKELVSRSITVIKAEKKILARGGFASIHKAASTTHQYAVRVLHQTNTREVFNKGLKEQQSAQTLLTSLAKKDPALTGLQKPEISRVISVINGKTGKTENTSNWYQASLSDLCLGDAFDIQIKDLKQKQLIARQITKGLATIHNSNIIHGDLKLENILLEGSGTRTTPTITHARIADFGGAVDLNEDQWNNIPTNTADMTLENDSKIRENLKTTYKKKVTQSLKDEIGQHEKKIDIFQMGIILFNLYTEIKKLPSLDVKVLNKGTFISKPKYVEIRMALLKTNLTDDQKRMISKMLSADAKKRPTADEVSKAFNLPG